MAKSDTELIQRTLQGDDNAFAFLVDKYKGAVHALAYRKCGDFHTAEEIAQDAFLKAYQKLGMLKEPQRFPGWLYVITARCYLSWQRRQRLRPQALNEVPPAQMHSLAWSKYNQQQQREAVHDALESLPESERTVLTLHYLGGQTCEELSHFIGTSHDAAKKRLYRARCHLKKEMVAMLSKSWGAFQLPFTFTSRIAEQIRPLNPTPPVSSRPFPYWFGAPAAMLLLGFIGWGVMQTSSIQKPYSFTATADGVVVEVIDAPFGQTPLRGPNLHSSLGTLRTPKGEKSMSAEESTTQQMSISELKPQLDWIPTGKPNWHSGWMNGYARGLQLVLNHLGHDVDYETIMGDMGLAFIVQGEENSINVFEGAVDVGWWPLEPLGMIRLNFLEKTVGWEIQDIKLPRFEPKKKPVNTYKQWFEPMVISSVEKGKPCLVRVGSAWYIVTGYDDEESPLIGMCPNEEEGKEKIYRIEEPMPPYASLAIGEATPAMDRMKADFEALKFAVALHRDKVLGTDAQYPGESPLRRADEFGKYWRTGLKSFSSWITCLQDTEHFGQPFWHSNVVGHLYWNRRTAVRYLKAMQKRHSEPIATHLENAIEKYQAVIGELNQVDVGGEAISSVEGREKLIESIQEIANLESQAVAELEKAEKAFRMNLHNSLDIPIPRGGE